MSGKYFSKMEIDAIGEILNISLGASATAISTMLSARVDITTPIVNILDRDEFALDKVDPAVGVEITYVEGLEGENIMLLKRHDVKVIVEMLMGMEISDEEFELNEMNISAVCEVMNQMMGASSTALSEFLGQTVNISTPISFEVKNQEEFVNKYFTDDMPKVVVLFTLKIADRLESEFFNVMPMGLAKALVKGFLPEDQILGEGAAAAEEEEEPAEDSVKEEAPAPALEEAPKAAETAEAPSSSGGGMMSQEEIEAMLNGGKSNEPEPTPAVGTTQKAPEAAAAKPAAAEPQAQEAPQIQEAPQMQAAPQMQTMPQMTAQPVNGDVAAMQIQMMQQMMQQMQQMQQTQQQLMESARIEPKTIRVQTPSSTPLRQEAEMVLQGEQEENMELILGVPLEISVEIGRTQKLVKDILDFTRGSLVVLDKLAGEQVDLFVNGQCVAKGDVVVVEDNFGVRITEIMKVNILALE